MIKNPQDILVKIMAARWLGHGRAVESYLSLVAFIYGMILLLTPTAPFESRATADIAWAGYGLYIAFPLLIKSCLSITGLVLNVKGYPKSRIFRFSGATIGTMVWTFLATKFVLIDLVGSVGFPFCLISIIFSIRIMGLALANLPRPGAPGLM